MNYAILLLLLSVPVGFLIAWLARDELVVGRKWIRLLSGLSVVIIIIGALLDELVWVYTSLFILIVCCISLWKSHDRRWTKRKL